MADEIGVSITKSQNDVMRWGVAAVFAIALVTVGAAVALVGPASAIEQPFGLDPVESSLPSVSRTLLFAVIGLQGVLFATGTLMVMRMVSDVRRHRLSTSSTPNPVVGPEAAVIEHLELALDREQSYSEIVSAVAGLTGSDGVFVLADGDVVASAGVRHWMRDPAAHHRIADVLSANRPRRWVDPEHTLSSACAFIAAPLHNGAEVVGVAVGHRLGDRPFGLADLDLLCRIAAVDVGPAPTFVDRVTSLPNRRRFDLDLDETLAGSDGEVGLAVVSVDHLLRLRHAHGPVVADTLAERVGDILSHQVRSGDLVYRYDSERFGVLLPSADAAQTAEVAERLRVAIASHEFTVADVAEPLHLTVSVGTVVAGPAADGDDTTVLVEAATEALDLAERMGRNRVLAGRQG